VSKGQRVEKGDILTEGYATENGELALGRNLLVAYMPWKGYNYEDAIVLNERIVREDVLTSVHVEEFLLMYVRRNAGMRSSPAIFLMSAKKLRRIWMRMVSFV
jgi:DNA-directed RNA polymerase subunit beta